MALFRYRSPTDYDIPKLSSPARTWTNSSPARRPIEKENDRSLSPFRRESEDSLWNPPRPLTPPTDQEKRRPTPEPDLHLSQLPAQSVKESNSSTPTSCNGFSPKTVSRSMQKVLSMLSHAPTPVHFEEIVDLDPEQDVKVKEEEELLKTSSSPVPPTLPNYREQVNCPSFLPERMPGFTTKDGTYVSIPPISPDIAPPANEAGYDSDASTVCMFPKSPPQWTPRQCEDDSEGEIGPKRFKRIARLDSIESDDDSNAPFCSPKKLIYGILKTTYKKIIRKDPKLEFRTSVRVRRLTNDDIRRLKRRLRKNSTKPHHRYSSSSSKVSSSHSHKKVDNERRHGEKGLSKSRPNGSTECKKYSIERSKSAVGKTVASVGSDKKEDTRVSKVQPSTSSAKEAESLSSENSEKHFRHFHPAKVQERRKTYSEGDPSRKPTSDKTNKDLAATEKPKPKPKSAGKMKERRNTSSVRDPKEQRGPSPVLQAKSQSKSKAPVETDGKAIKSISDNTKDKRTSDVDVSKAQAGSSKVKVTSSDHKAVSKPSKERTEKKHSSEPKDLEKKSSSTSCDKSRKKERPPKKDREPEKKISKPADGLEVKPAKIAKRRYTSVASIEQASGSKDNDSGAPPAKISKRRNTHSNPTEESIKVSDKTELAVSSSNAQGGFVSDKEKLVCTIRNYSMWGHIPKNILKTGDASAEYWPHKRMEHKPNEVFAEKNEVNSVSKPTSNQVAAAVGNKTTFKEKQQTRVEPKEGKEKQPLISPNKPGQSHIAPNATIDSLEKPQPKALNASIQTASVKGILPLTKALQCHTLPSIATSLKGATGQSPVKQGQVTSSVATEGRKESVAKPTHIVEGKDVTAPVQIIPAVAVEGKKNGTNLQSAKALAQSQGRKQEGKVLLSKSAQSEVTTPTPTKPTQSHISPVSTPSALSLSKSSSKPSHPTPSSPPRPAPSTASRVKDQAGSLRTSAKPGALSPSSTKNKYQEIQSPPRDDIQLPLLPENQEPKICPLYAPDSNMPDPRLSVMSKRKRSSRDIGWSESLYTVNNFMHLYHRRANREKVQILSVEVVKESATAFITKPVEKAAAVVAEQTFTLCNPTNVTTTSVTPVNESQIVINVDRNLRGRDLTRDAINRLLDIVEVPVLLHLTSSKYLFRSNQSLWFLERVIASTDVSQRALFLFEQHDGWKAIDGTDILSVIEHLQRRLDQHLIKPVPRIPYLGCLIVVLKRILSEGMASSVAVHLFRLAQDVMRDAMHKASKPKISVRTGEQCLV